MEYTGDELFKKATDLMVQGKDLDNVFHSYNLLFNKTITDEENRDVLLFHLASAAMKKGYQGLSVLLFKNLLKTRPNCHEAINNIGFIYKKELLNDQAIKCFEVAFDIADKANTDNFKDESKKQLIVTKAEYMTNIGSMYIANGTPAKAIECFDKALKIDPNCDLAKWNRSLAYLELGNYEKGFSDYDSGERYVRVQNRQYGIEGLPIWDGKPDKNKTVVVLGEQGIGDEIMFASVIPEMAKDCNVIVDGHPRLADLFRLNFPRIPIYGTRKSEKVTWPEFSKIDAVIGMGSLFRYYRKKKEDFPGTPYLRPSQKWFETYRDRLSEMGDKPKIGISWMGGNHETGRENRTIKLEILKDLLSIDVDFISLQYDKGIAPKINRFEEKNNIRLNHWEDVLADYDKTAGLVANLDLVISVPQSVVNLAGSMGINVFQLVPFKALWQPGPYGEDMPCYKSVKNFWQDESCSWEPVINKVKDELCNLLQTSIAA